MPVPILGSYFPASCIFPAGPTMTYTRAETGPGRTARANVTSNSVAAAGEAARTVLARNNGTSRRCVTGRAPGSGAAGRVQDARPEARRQPFAPETRPPSRLVGERGGGQRGVFGQQGVAAQARLGLEVPGGQAGRAE